MVHVLLGVGNPLLDRLARQPGIAGNLRAKGAAEQLVDRLIERLTDEVPQRNVYRRERFEHEPGAVAAQPHRGVEMVPQYLDGQRVLSQEQRREEVRNDGLCHAGHRRRMRLAPPHQAVIGSQPHQQRLIYRRIRAEMPPVL